jgi:mannose/cellobiose epimerase-like protein (N-acyl-D-glucosamine 2-epimerase family)
MTSDTAQDLFGWLTGTLLPRWIERAYDPARPGYVEIIQTDGTPDEGELRTTLVTARLVYVFSHAHCLGVPGALQAARHGLSFLLDKCQRGDGLFSHSCTVMGDVVDGRSDFYDLAFVIFALGWYARASGEAEPLAQAEKVMVFIEDSLASPAGGFLEDTLGSLPRRQNPHMHLLEACHALAEVSADPRWLSRANAIVSLMQDRFLDTRTGSLGEFFNDDWSPCSGVKGQVREPGHHYEWVWLLYHHERLTGSTTVRKTARELYAFAERLGGGSPRPVVNEVDPNGALLNDSALLWPQTEYLKALVARIEFEHDGAAASQLASHLRLMLSRFVDRRTGLWANQLDRTGQPIAAPIPVRVLYHLVLALAEICRVTGDDRASAAKLF